MRTNPRSRLLTGTIVLLIMVGSIYSNAQCPSPCQGLSNPLEFEALQALYCATDGDNWFVNTGWAEGINDGTNCDYCTWYGIKCNEDQQVIAIDLDGMVDFDFNALDGNNLNGHLPIELANLNLLSEIFLSENKLKDTVPIRIMANKDILYLDLSHNDFSKIDFSPANDQAYIFCTHLDLSHNQISVDPSEIANNGMLIDSLNLSHNLLTTSLPGLGLIWLNLSHNFLSGSLDAIIENTNSRRLELCHNDISGNLDILAGNTRIRQLHASHNNLSGTLDAIVDNTALRWVDLSHNNLEGGVSASISFLPNIYRLDLSYNQLSGCFPQTAFGLCENQRLKLIGNMAMPWEGSTAAFCATNGLELEQIGQPCDDGNDENGTDDKIDQDCNCVPQTVNNQSIEVGITIGPNPTDGKINITSNRNTKLAYVIHDLDGITRSRDDLGADLIDIGHLPTGLYILTIIDESGQRLLTKKIIRV